MAQHDAEVLLLSQQAGDWEVDFFPSEPRAAVRYTGTIAGVVGRGVEAQASVLRQLLSERTGGRPLIHLVFRPVLNSDKDLYHQLWSVLEALLKSPGASLVSSNVYVEIPGASDIGRDGIDGFSRRDVAALLPTLRAAAPDGTLRLVANGNVEIMTCRADLPQSGDTAHGQISRSATCDIAGQDPLFRKLNRLPPLSFSPPGYVKSKWRPEQVPHIVVWQIAQSQQRLAKRQMLNPTAHVFMLATVLTERAYQLMPGASHHGVRGQLTDYYAAIYADINRVLGTSYDPRQLDGLWKTYTWHDPLTIEQGVIGGIVFGLVFNYKTGAYADAIHGKRASRAQRLALWNGVGKVKLQRQLWADADQHASKVESLHRSIAGEARSPTEKSSYPANRDLASKFSEYGGTLTPI